MSVQAMEEEQQHFLLPSYKQVEIHTRSMDEFLSCRDKLWWEIYCECHFCSTHLTVSVILQRATSASVFICPLTMLIMVITKMRVLVYMYQQEQKDAGE